MLKADLNLGSDSSVIKSLDNSVTTGEGHLVSLESSYRICSTFCESQDDLLVKKAEKGGHTEGHCEGEDH